MECDEPEAWEELYAEAVLETDPSKIENRINKAQGRASRALAGAGTDAACP